MRNPVLRSVNVCTYRVKAGHEAEMEALLAQHWPALRKAGLATAQPSLIYRGQGSEASGGEHDAAGVYVEVFAWVDAKAPERAHESPEVMAVWKPMGAICESMEFPGYDELELGFSD